MIDFSSIRYIIFDADDTLWDCQSHFDNVTKTCARILSKYTQPSNVEDKLYETERCNMSLMGYGTKAYTISLLENALRVSNFRVEAKEIMEILSLGKSLLSLPATPLPGVEEILSQLVSTNKYKLILFTKGESLDQKAKITRSGLFKYFEKIIIVDDKTDKEYYNLCQICNAKPKEMLMVGNSFRSDIAPALKIGANAIYIPFHVTWALEQAETFEHEKLITLDSFLQLKDIFNEM